MSPSETIEFLKEIGATDIYVVLSGRSGVHLGNVEEELQKIKGLGYAAFVRQTALGTEIVVTEKVYSPDLREIMQRVSTAIALSHD